MCYVNRIETYCIYFVDIYVIDWQERQKERERERERNDIPFDFNFQKLAKLWEGHIL
jgi:hypothetical protein